MTPQTRKTVELTIPLDLLCNLWESRTNPNQTLDDRIEELVILGLKTSGNKSTELLPPNKPQNEPQTMKQPQKTPHFPLFRHGVYWIL
jgi:hypothetical protein